nr:MAG TPA: AntA/AntB antirepressor [Bacteriophage sp.]
MNDLETTKMQTPIEIALGVDENGMTTARALYEFLELAQGQFSRWAKTNIEQNEFYEENKDWWGFDIVSNGNNCKDYRLTTDFAKHLSMESHSSKGKIARQYFITVEDKAKEMAINRSQLSPQMQMFYAIADGQAKMELEQKRQAEQMNRIEQKQDAIVETFQKTDSVEDFQKWANDRIAQIAESTKFDKGYGRSKNYSLARSESYERLKQKRNCRLDDRVQKAKGRALEERPDIKKSELDKINKIYIIANDKDLRPAYELVIKEMMVYYCVSDRKGGLK